MILILSSDYLHVQQTPNPAAHDPALRPPLLEHSSLNAKMKYFKFS